MTLPTGSPGGFGRTLSTHPPNDTPAEVGAHDETTGTQELHQRSPMDGGVMNLLGEAIRWHKLGYTPLPIKPNGSKAPAVQSWTHWQDAQPPIGDIITAFTVDHDGLGILTGPGSGNFELLEMEGRGVTEGLLPILAQAFADHDMAELWQRIDGGYSETTPSGGIHWYYRVDDCPVQGNTPLARRPSTEEELAEKPNTRQVLIETRGRGGFTVIAPSTGRTHDTGRSWVVRTGAPETIPTLTADEYEAVHAIASTLDQMPAADPQPAPVTRPRLPGDPKLPGDDLNERATWEEILIPHGWKLVHRSGQYAKWSRPGKRSPGISATTGKSPTGDRLFVFSTSTDFEVQTPYNKFGAYALLNHGGDFQAAASALRGQGYGDAEEDPMNGLYAGPGQERNQFTVADVPPQPADSGDAEEAEGGAAPTWQPVDLATFLDGTYRPAEPALLPRSDGVHLLYPGLTHSFHGESESGKSLVAQAEAVRVLNQGGTVLFCDFESDPASVVGRLLMLGAHPNAIRERFKYVQPETNLTSSIEAAAWNATLGQLFDLAVIDGVTASLGLFGGETKDNDNVTRWARLLPDRIARKTGAAVVSVDHVTKNADTRGRFAIGGQAKMAALTGAAYVVEVVQPLGRDLRGVIVLRVGKDRPGYIRARSGAWRAQDRTQEAARVVVDSTGPRTLVTVEAPQGVTPGSDDFRPTGLMERISRMLEQATDPQSFNQIDQDIEGKREYKRTALATLGQEGYISIATGQRQAQLHASVKPYRQTADPKSDHYAGGNQSAAKNGSEGGLDRFPLKGGEPGTSRLPVPGTSREPVGNREPGRHARETGLEGLISPVTPGNWPESGPETPENQSESVPGPSGNQSGTSGNQSELLGAETQSGRGGNQSGTSQASPGTSREPVGTSRLGAGTPEAAPIRAEAADAGCPDCGGPLDPQRAAAGYNCLACYRRATA